MEVMTWGGEAVGDARSKQQGHAGSRPLLPLTLAALGVVFGDLGTSPLYALQEAFHGRHAVDVTHENVLGVVSLFVWALLLSVSAKYLFFVMRADNRGEGGIFALLALTGARGLPRARARRWLVGLGLFGAALLYGDGVITPAISVLSAVEGLEVASPLLRPVVIPVTAAILIGLFLVQRHGSGRMGNAFGPVIALWFLAMAVLGLRALVSAPEVLLALNPAYAVQFFLHHGLHGVTVLGAVVLCITGGEALYADMGHFGARPIRVAWFALVLPSLILGYLGQGALLLRSPAAAARPFYSMAPGWLLYPMVGLATLATIIASQALITAVFSLTRQAMQLGYWPRVHVVHTSSLEEGQVYVPGMNWALMLGTLALVLGFRSASGLAGAYGLAVAGTMAVTTVLFARVARRLLRWSRAACAAFLVVFLSVDLAFLGANLLKLREGGWLPLVIGAAFYTLMAVWAHGRRLLREELQTGAVSCDEFLARLDRGAPLQRVPGTAIFLTAHPGAMPVALLHYLKHAKSLHEHVVLVTLHMQDVSHVSDDERVEVQALSQGFWRVTGRYGYMEDTDVPGLIACARRKGLNVPTEDATFFVSREIIMPSDAGRWGGWGERLYGFMRRNARPAAAFFGLPPAQVMEVGTEVDL